jgi:hypothetical protein
MENIIPLKQRFWNRGLSAHADQGCSIGFQVRK